jgi:energy-coupling factor transport system permease protein
VTWLVWAIAVTVSLQLARNPLLVAIALAVVWLVVERHRRPGSLSRAFPVVLAMAVAFGVLRVLLIGLTTPLDPGSGGSALVALPQATLPTALGGFSIGGAISQAVVLQTAIDSLVVVGIIATFGAFNAVASHHELLGAAPRAFHEPGLVLTVAMAFVPSTLDAATAAREADRARTGGVRVRRGRTLRLALPVLETGLERAVRLAESMDSRGYGRVRPQPLDRLAAGLSGVALLGLASSVVALVGQSGGVAGVLAAVAVVALVAAVVLSGRSAPTRYRPRRLTRRDALVVTGVLAVPVVLAACAVADVHDLAWDPAVLPLRWPGLPVVPAIALVGLALPAAIPPAASSPPALHVAESPAAIEARS